MDRRVAHITCGSVKFKIDRDDIYEGKAVFPPLLLHVSDDEGVYLDGIFNLDTPCQVRILFDSEETRIRPHSLKLKIQPSWEFSDMWPF